MRFFTAASVAALASSACSAATIEDYPWIGAGGCLDANGNTYDSYASPTFPPEDFDHDCVTWCLQNPDGLRGVEVYRHEAYGGVRQCLCQYDNPLPQGLVYSNPAAVGTYEQSVGTGPITQTNPNSVGWRACFAKVSTQLLHHLTL